MNVQAEVSLYPLRQLDLAEPIQQFVERLIHDQLQVNSGAMSTNVAGESRLVFESLKNAFEQIAEKYEAVVTIKISNACKGFKEL
ncbi:YkoF family thiamine/hydroxymethylpyrimidine-binding protein [Planctomycetota bacterium]